MGGGSGGFFVRQLIGFDDKAFARIKRRQIEQGKSLERPPSLLYQSISTMREFGMVPDQWEKLSRLDKKVLHYYRAMEGYYFDIARAEAEQKTKTEKEKQRFHKMQRRGRGR